MNCQAKKSSDGLTDSNEGRVFGHRSNSRGQLGFEQGKSEVHSFTVISSLSENQCSLRLHEGKVLAHGWSCYI